MRRKRLGQIQHTSGVDFGFELAGENEDRCATSQVCDRPRSRSAASGGKVGLQQTDVVGSRRCCYQCRVRTRVPVNVETGVLQRRVVERSQERVSFDMQDTPGRREPSVAVGRSATGIRPGLGYGRRPLLDFPHAARLRAQPTAANPGYHPFRFPRQDGATHCPLEFEAVAADWWRDAPFRVGGFPRLRARRLPGKTV